VFGDFSGGSLMVLDIVRWTTVIWLIVAMGWMIQIAVMARTTAVTLLALGISISLFVDLGDQYERISADHVSYRLPLTYIELILITYGMYLYAKNHSQIKFIPPFYLFLKYRKSRRNQSMKERGG
jgi:hypothetical protein